MKNKKGKPKRKVFLAGEQIPEDLPFAYIVAKDGFFMRKKNKIYTATVQLKELAAAKECEQSCIFKPGLPRMPYKLIHRAHEFFAAVYDKMKAEAMVYITFEDNKWGISAPEQEATGSSVNYQHEPGVTPVGTIHSHCDMGAFYSSTDNNDDSEADGIHIVLGKITQSTPQLILSVVVNGKRFTIRPEDFIDDMPNPLIRVNKKHKWLDRVNKKVFNVQSSAVATSYNRRGSYLGGTLPLKEWGRDRDWNSPSVSSKSSSGGNGSDLLPFQMTKTELENAVWSLRKEARKLKKELVKVQEVEDEPVAVTPAKLETLRLGRLDVLVTKDKPADAGADLESKPVDVSGL